MAKQVNEILIKLGIDGLQGLDKLKSSFRELEKSIGPSNATIEKARRSIIEFGDASSRTEQVIRGQLEAFKGLRGQAEIGSATYGKLTNNIAALEVELRGSTVAIDQQRQSILRATAASERNAQALQQQVRALTELQRQARPGSSAFAQLGKDIDGVKTKLTGLGTEAQQFSRALNAGFGATPEKLGSQIATLRRGLVGLRFDSEKYLETLERIRLLSITQAGRTGRAEVIAGFQAFQSPIFRGGYADPSRLPDLPDTTAALEQQLSELTGELANVERGSARYVEVSNRMADIQRELRRELTGTAEAFRRLETAQAGVERRADKIAGIQEYYRTQGPMAPGVGGFRDPATGAIIAAGARTPGRIRVEEAAYPSPIGPQAFPEAGRRAQESIQQAMNDVNRIYEDARIRRVELQSKYDQIQIDKMLDGLDLEGQVREKGFRDELAAFDRQLEARDRRRRGRLTTGQAVQSAGAIISGGIFGGPEGFLGGLGGFAAGLAIPGLGPVGGAFAGAAGGAQFGAIRQQLGVFAEQAAEISKLRRGLAGVSVDLNDFAEAVQATQAASDSLLIPLGQTIRFYTQLRASTVELNYSAEDTRQILEGTASAVLKTGGSLDDVNGAMRAVIQILSKGKVSAEEMRGQLGERLPGAVIKFAQVNNMSVQELDKAFEDGLVTLEKFFNFARKNYEDGAKYANDMATGTEFAGQRMEKALERLRLAIGSRLKESGAGFQNFVTEVVNSLLWAGGELERFGSKVEEFLGSRQFGVSGSTREIAEQIIGGGLSTQDLDAVAEEYINKINELENRFAAQKDRNIFQQLFDETLGQGTITEKQLDKTVGFYIDLLKKIDAARQQAEKATRQGKAGAATGAEDPETLKERQKLGQQYLQALEQREEALFNARRQREEQIAQIRKNAIEQAAQIERQLADERRSIERDMERVRREMQAGSGEIDRLRRLAQGEDPRIIEAERAAVQISQQATEDRIRAEEDLLDKELQQQRTIADFQKNTAKQIADANENYAKRVGEIQRDFAKASAKIIEEGSGRAAKRITLAAQIVSQVLQRSSLNQQRTQFGLQPIGEPTGFVGGRPVYGGLQQGEVPDQIKRIDQNLEQLLRKLSTPQSNQGSLPAARASSSGIGEQFLSLIGSERGYEDVAGLLPLPIQRMQRQAARPLRMVWESIQNAMEGIYGATEKQIKKTFKPDPARSQQVLQRIQKTQEVILNWNPLEAQWKETENQIREQKRSKASRMPISSFVAITKDIHQGMSEELRKAGALATRANERSFFDFSDFVSPQQQQILTTGIKESLSAAMDQSFSELRQLNGRGGNDPSGMPSFSNAIQRLAPVINQFRSLFEEVLSQEAASGQRYAMDAIKKLGMQAPVDMQFYRSPAYTQPGLIQERLDRLYNQPNIQPGVEGQFEGAMLPGGSFNISRLARNFGNIASASAGSPLQYFPAIAQNVRGAAPTSQMRGQATQQRFEQIDQQALIKAYEVLSQVKSSSAQTLENFQLQNREIELQIQNLSDGMEPELASQLSGLRSNYEVQQQQLEIQRQALINAGLNAEAVNQAYVAESAALAQIYEQNQAAIAQYREKQKVLEAIQDTSSILESNLTSAISNSIQVLVTGSGTVKQVLADTLKSIGQAFIQMAAQIIAKQLAMIALGSIMKALGLTAGASSGRFSGGYFDPATGLGAAGPNFGLAKGGYFAGGMANLPANSIIPFANGGIVSKPTFFKFANGGAMSAGVMGEAGPEAIMPLKRGADGKLGVAARLDGAMKRYRSTPGSAAAAAEGDSAALAAAGAATMEPIDVRYSIERINNVDYVTADQFQAGMAQAAQQGAIQGERRAMRTLTNSAAARGRLRI